MVALRETETTAPLSRNPVGVVILSKDNKKVLLVSHAALRKRGEWGIPGGRPKGDETPLETAVREVREETGLELEPKDLIRIPGIYTGVLKRESGEKTYSIDVFIARNFLSDLKISRETTPVWANVDSLKRKRQRLMPSVEQIVSDSLQLVNES